MAKIKKIKKWVAGEPKAYCENCKHNIDIVFSSVQVDMPYCSKCNKIVLDLDQNYCCWCGEKFED